VSTLHKILFVLSFCLLLSCGEKKPVEVNNINVSEQKTTENPAQVDIQTGPQISIDQLIGTANPAEDSLFAKIDIAHADREGLYMHKEAYVAFKKLSVAAEAQGIDLVIRSAARNFNYQKGIWERKWTGETKLSSGENAQQAYPDKTQRALKILEYSSMPGTSRHHWGTDIDLNSFENSWFESGEGLKLFNFMETVGKDYGFCRPYTEKGDVRPDGYNEEKWHYSYIPVSKYYTEYAKQHLSNNNIKGFEGSEVASQIDVVNKYVLGINQSCNH